MLWSFATPKFCLSLCVSSAWDKEEQFLMREFFSLSVALCNREMM